MRRSGGWVREKRIIISSFPQLIYSLFEFQAFQRRHYKEAFDSQETSNDTEIKQRLENVVSRLQTFLCKQVPVNSTGNADILSLWDKDGEHITSNLLNFEKIPSYADIGNDRNTSFGTLRDILLLFDSKDNWSLYCPDYGPFMASLRTLLKYFINVFHNYILQIINM